MQSSEAASLEIVVRMAVCVAQAIGAVLNAHYRDMAVALRIMTTTDPFPVPTPQDLMSWPEQPKSLDVWRPAYSPGYLRRSPVTLVATRLPRSVLA